MLCEKLMRLSLWICWNRIIFIFLKRSFAAGTEYRMKCVWHLADFHSFCLGSCPVSAGPLGFTWPWCNRRFQLAQGQEGNPSLGGRDVRCAVHLESCSLKSNIDVTLWNVSNFLFPTLLSLTVFRLFSSDVGCFRWINHFFPGCAQKSSYHDFGLFRHVLWSHLVYASQTYPYWSSSGKGTKRIAVVKFTWAWIHVHCRTGPLVLNLQEFSSSS